MLWVMVPDANYYRRVARHWDLVNQLRPPNIQKGIFKFKSIQEANQHRDNIDFESALRIYLERFEKKKMIIKKH